MKISYLPNGIDAKSVSVHHDTNYWTFKPEVSTKGDLLRQSINKNIRYKMGTEYRDYKLVQVLADDLVLSRKKISFIVPKDNPISIYPDRKNNPHAELDLYFYKKNIPEKFNISYQINSLVSAIHYVGKYDEKTGELTLSGFCQINNLSGIKHKNTEINIQIGHLPQRVRPLGMMTFKATSLASVGPIDDFYIYKLKGTFNLEKGLITTIPLFADLSFEAKKRYLFKTQYSRNDVSSPLDLEISFQNTSNMPLASGQVQIFSGKTDLVGEALLDYTPKEKFASFIYGKTAQIMGKKTLINVSKVTKASTNKRYRITLTNHKNRDISVKVLDRIFSRGSWRIHSSTHKFTKKSHEEIEFQVAVPKKSSVDIDYEIKIEALDKTRRPF